MATYGARVGARMVPGLAAKDALAGAIAATSILMRALAGCIVFFAQMSATTDVANQGGRSTRALRGHVVNTMAPATLTESGCIARHFNTAMGAEHPDTVAAEGGGELAVPVQENDENRGVRQRCEADVAKNPTRVLTELHRMDDRVKRVW